MILTKCFSPTDLLLAQLGQHNGVINITDTVQVTGKFYSVQTITSSVFTALTENNSSGSLTGVTIPAGVTLNGEFTSIKLASGAVRAFRA